MPKGQLPSLHNAVMFKFDFAIDDIDEELDASIARGAQDSQTEVETQPQAAFLEHSMEQFLDALPSLVSYSPLSVPISSTNTTVDLVRRDLFDARFQLISEGSFDLHEPNDAQNEDGTPHRVRGIDPAILSYLDAPSDLLPGVYEGGLKTWECSLDLVEYLESSGLSSTYGGKRVIELGCGTAVPSLYILGRALSMPLNAEETHIHLQDYNASVLELVTFPNIVLTWYLSSASSSYRETCGEDIDPTSAGELPITDELKSAFVTSLKERNIRLRFFSGSWETFDLSVSGGTYNLILTSETIYRQESLPSLIRLLDEGSAESLNSLMSAKLSLQDHFESRDKPQCLCLVAAKVLYFGVGGGISDFVDTVAKHQPRAGMVETVLEKTTGIGRKVLRLEWC